jgi:hypothetical protein
MKDICKDYYNRMYLCEDQKWDLEHEVRKRDWEVLPKNCLDKSKHIREFVYKNTQTKLFFATHFDLYIFFIKIHPKKTT